MEYEPAKDAFKDAFAPTEIKGHWKDLEGLERVGTTEPKKKKVFFGGANRHWLGVTVRTERQP